MSRIIDEWSEVNLNGETLYRVLEAPDGSRSLEARGPFDAEFHAPTGKAGALARRLMALRSEMPRAEEADVLRMGRSA